MSYLSNYFSITPEEKNEKVKSFFTGLDAMKEMITCESKVKKLKRELSEAENEYTIKRNLGYSVEYTPCKINPVIKYKSNRASNTLYFDAITGTQLSEPTEGALIYDIEYKNGTVSIVTGYAYNLGAAVVRNIEYAIPSTNNKINYKIISECLKPLLGGDMMYVYRPMSGTVEERCADYARIRNWRCNWFPTECKATEFLNKMYDIDKIFEELDLNDVAFYSKNNKAFETIVKTAPANCLKLLLEKKYEKNTSIPKLLGIQDEQFTILIKEDLLEDFIRLQDYVKTNEQCFIGAKFEKTWPEYIQYLIDCKRWSENIGFYNISVNYGSYLWKDLLDYYLGIEYGYKDRGRLFRTNYKFGKFCNYIISESIDQGFRSISNFTSTLGDYLAICEKYGTKPTLYSSDLNKIHNIVVRNHQITFTPEQISDFASKYTGFKDVEIDDKYVITNPKYPQDMQKEGDELNSCLCFYVHKVLKDECTIFFLRLKEAIKDSLVTVEVRDNAIVQAAGMLNRDVTDEERVALEKFAKDSKLELRI